MDRLASDLQFMKHELDHETDQFRRNLLLNQIRDIEIKIVKLTGQEQADLEEEKRNYEKAIAKLTAMKNAAAGKQTTEN